MAQLVKHLCQHGESEFTFLALTHRDWHDEIPALGRRKRRIPGPCCPDRLAELQVQCRDHASKTKGRMIEEDTQCHTLASTWIPHPQMARSYLLAEV